MKKYKSEKLNIALKMDIENFQKEIIKNHELFFNDDNDIIGFIIKNKDNPVNEIHSLLYNKEGKRVERAFFEYDEINKVWNETEYENS